jgi:hypothetical protein
MRLYYTVTIDELHAEERKLQLLSTLIKLAMLHFNEATEAGAVLEPVLTDTELRPRKRASARTQ